MTLSKKDKSLRSTINPYKIERFYKNNFSTSINSFTLFCGDSVILLYNSKKKHETMISRDSTLQLKKQPAKFKSLYVNIKL